MSKVFAILSFLICANLSVWSQEIVSPLQNNPYTRDNINGFSSKKQRATLPFVDDFSYRSSTPDSRLWEESQVFINNTMGREMPTMGVATFDGLNEEGRPYRPSDFLAVGFADSLTCTPIDLSFRNPVDSIVLSFFLQPQGNGFGPELGDSFYVFFRNSSGTWDEKFRLFGTSYRPFKQFFVSVNDPQYFHDSFQFRFVNFSSLNLNDDIWNLDYVRLGVNRSHNDTTLRDIGFVDQPTSILNTYTALPFRHFATSDLSVKQDVSLRNIYDASNSFTLNHNARELNTNTVLSTNVLAPFNMFPKSFALNSIPSYPIGLSGSGPYVIRNTYFINQLSGLDNSSNDTMISDVVFDNYFAYDDGTAELAYFLSAAQNQAAKTAMKFELKQADSVYGLSVFFAAQVPSAAGKMFSMVLYDSLGNSSSGDVILEQQDFLTVQYPANRGEFSFYAFDQPVALGPGTYYIGIQQPANSGSDSIYYGLDVNNDNNINELSYNINGFWFNSSTQGTVMMRPMVGGSFTPTEITNLSAAKETTLYPNPAKNIIRLKSKVSWKNYELYNMTGQMMERGLLRDNQINLEQLPVGQYSLKLFNDKKSETHKIWKQ